MLEKLATLGFLTVTQGIGLVGMVSPAAVMREPREGHSAAGQSDLECGLVEPQQIINSTQGDEFAPDEPWAAINLALAEAAGAAARANVLHQQAATEIEGAVQDLEVLRALLPSGTGRAV